MRLYILSQVCHLDITDFVIQMEYKQDGSFGSLPERTFNRQGYEMLTPKLRTGGPDFLDQTAAFFFFNAKAFESVLARTACMRATRRGPEAVPNLFACTTSCIEGVDCESKNHS